MATVKKSNGSGKNQYGSWTIVEEPPKRTVGENSVHAVAGTSGGRGGQLPQYSGSYMGNDPIMNKVLGGLTNAGQASAPSISKPTYEGLSTQDAINEKLAIKKAEKTNKPPITEVLEDKGGGDYSSAAFGFTPSATYLKAMEYTNQLLAQLSSGRTAYTDKINGLMDQIANRDAFSYDPDSDTLFQNSLQSAMSNGKVAMQDTMGQAAALTGGYGSTYATAAANQAYNGFIQDAYSNLPDYYNLALEAYNMEGQNLYNQLGMYQTADDTEYSRLANAYSANAQAAANMYDQEYNNYWQTANANESARQFNANLAYKNAIADRDQANWEAEYIQSLVNNQTNSAVSDTQKKTLLANALSSANKFGMSSDQFSTYASNMANQYGLSVDEILDYVEANMDSPVYTLGSGGYADQWGGTNNANPTFTLVETKTDKNNNVYKDQYGNTYTRVQLEQMGYKFDTKGKVKTKG